MNEDINNDLPDSNHPLLDELKSAEFVYPPIASLIRRTGAFIIDLLILGVIGQILGWSMSSFWFELGPYGRLVGFALIVLYFGLAYSSIFHGQSMGMRLLKIAVRNSNNSPIGIGISFCRILIFALPALFNGWALPVFNSGFAQWCAVFIVFGIGGSLIYTLIFNVKTRQGLHDLICGTYVVNLPGKPIETFPKTSRKHYIVSGVILGVVLILASLVGPINSMLSSNANLGNTTKIYKALLADDRFFSAQVLDTTTNFTSISFSKSTRYISVNIWYKGVPSHEELTAITNDVARIVLENLNTTVQYDSIKIEIRSAYDLLFTSGYNNHYANYDLETWKKRITDSSLK